MKEPVHFYSTNDEFGMFSNFARYPVDINGIQWPTSEHYFQAMKFVASEDQDAIRAAKSPMVAARMGRDRKRKLKENWESIKDQIMREAVLAKFSQHNDIKEVLLSTKGREIVEHTENDSYWGDGGDGKGKNMLGQILMLVRDDLSS